MHTIEPYYNWRSFYTAEEDRRSPFFGREHSEFSFENRIYNYLIHPQWDEFGSNTLYLKVIYADYIKKFAMIELIGEWNDAVNNDIMWLKREVIERMQLEHIDKFILIGENVLNFHSSDDCYYQEWYEELDEGWIAAINFRDHILAEFRDAGIDYYINFGGELDELDWRPMTPQQLYIKVSGILEKRLN